MNWLRAARDAGAGALSAARFACRRRIGPRAGGAGWRVLVLLWRARRGDPGAQNDLGLYRAQGRWMARDYAAALDWFQRAAAAGNAAARCNIGILHARGLGVPRDYARAARCFQDAADRGDARAPFLLGKLHASGRGVARDPAAAAACFRLAAERGDAAAQCALADSCRGEDGGTVSIGATEAGAALHWYRLAAAQGHNRAQFSLGTLLAMGQDTPADLVAAHMWFSLAAAGARYPWQRQPAIGGRDVVAALMTPAELAAARRLARQWRPVRNGLAEAADTEALILAP